MSSCLFRVAAAVLTSWLVAGCAAEPTTQPLSTPPAPAAPAQSFGTEPGGALPGYLAPGQAPAGVRLLPPPPGEGSARLAEDRQVFRDTRSLQGSPRWVQATRDADLDMPGAVRAFDCAAEVRLDTKDEPTLVRLMTRVITDVAHAYVPAKDLYARRRPFIGTDAPVCTPKDQRLVESYSYPSGHSSIGFTWAMILAEAAPERTTDLVKRGVQYGQSRVVCGVHYVSDVEAGREIAAAVVARLNADPSFRADLAQAHVELEAARARGALPDPGQCKAEAEALTRPAY